MVLIQTGGMSITEHIQKYQRHVLQVERLSPYKEVVCFVVDNLEENYDHNQAIDVIDEAGA